MINSLVIRKKLWFHISDNSEMYLSWLLFQWYTAQTFPQNQKFQQEIHNEDEDRCQHNFSAQHKFWSQGVWVLVWVLVQSLASGITLARYLIWPIFSFLISNRRLKKINFNWQKDRHVNQLKRKRVQKQNHTNMTN